MKRTLFIRLIALLLCLCLAPTVALGYGETPVFTDPVTHSDITLKFDLYPDKFPQGVQADLKGWEAFLDKITFRGQLDVQNPLTDKVRAWFDGGVYLREDLVVPFQVDVYFAFRYLQSLALKGESMYFKMENFLEFMMKPRYFMDLPTDYIALLMYPEATLDMRDRFYTPLAELCKGEGDRVVAYDDLYDLCYQWEEMYANDGEDYNKLYFFTTCLLYNLGINYDVYDQIGMMTDYLNFLDTDGQGLIITVKDDVETYTIGEHVVFTRDVNSTRNFTLTLPDAEGNLLTVYSQEEIQDDWDGDNWYLALNITLAPEEEGQEPETFLAVTLDMGDIPLRELYQTSGIIRFHAEGTALDEPVSHTFSLLMNRTDVKYPNQAFYNLLYRHPETQENCFSIQLTTNNSEVRHTVLQERVYPQEDFFHLNDEYLQRIKESYIPSLALSFLPIITEMPAGVINDIIRFAEATDILVSLGIE